MTTISKATPLLLGRASSAAPIFGASLRAGIRIETRHPGTGRGRGARRTRRLARRARRAALPAPGARSRVPITPPAHGGRGRSGGRGAWPLPAASRRRRRRCRACPPEHPKARGLARLCSRPLSRSSVCGEARLEPRRRAGRGSAADPHRAAAGRRPTGLRTALGPEAVLDRERQERAAGRRLRQTGDAGPEPERALRAGSPKRPCAVTQSARSGRARIVGTGAQEIGRAAPARRDRPRRRRCGRRSRIAPASRRRSAHSTRGREEAWRASRM